MKNLALLLQKFLLSVFDRFSVIFTIVWYFSVNLKYFLLYNNKIILQRQTNYMMKRDSSICRVSVLAYWIVYLLLPDEWKRFSKLIFSHKIVANSNIEFFLLRLFLKFRSIYSFLTTTRITVNILYKKKVVNIFNVTLGALSSVQRLLSSHLQHLEDIDRMSIKQCRHTKYIPLSKAL